MRTLKNVIQAMNRREGFKGMNAKNLLKRDLNYKLKLVLIVNW